MRKGKVSKELMGASSIPLILSILAQGNTYGFEIIKKIKILSEERILWKEGSIYPVLKRLEAQKLVKSYWVTDGDRPRKYYSICKAGKKALDKNQDEWNLMSGIFSKLLEPQTN